MQNLNKNNFLFNSISSVKGVGLKLRKYLKNKKIEKVKDLLLDLPYEVTDRSKISDLNELEIGKIATVKIIVLKYNFPRIRNLPNKVICGDKNKKIDIVFFNSREGYIKKVLPIGKKIFISGKIGYYKKRYQITNPTYIELENNESKIAKIFPKYSLTEGITEKIYRKLIKQTLDKIQDADDWYNQKFLKKNNFQGLKETLLNLHNPEKKINIQSNDYKRLAYDEIFSNLITLLSARRIVRIKKKEKKVHNNKFANIILKNFPFNLTKNQKKILKDLNDDIRSENRMFRLLQGDVGSGKTILGLIVAANVIESNYQAAFMAPTEILSSQHYQLAKKLFSSTDIKIELLTSSIPHKNKKEIALKLANGEIDLIFGTHSLFQKKIKFLKLGFVVIDEQHKFGVKQRLDLAKKGGNNCDVLVMSATPIPRTMMLSFFGDMDISRLREKPKNRKDIITLIKPENKISELWPFLKKQISLDHQIFWVCPLIEQSNKLDYSSAKKKYDIIKKIFPGNVGLIHGNLDESEKKIVLDKFLKKIIKILVSTTVIEVGIDFPSANTMVIENANKFGLSQLHQLRGRVGRGKNESTCVLLYKKNLSENAKKRLKILKSTNDGFLIADEDLKLRGHGDILGFQQSGIKNFKFADPIHHKDLFLLAEE
ncbi:MAG: ATP-dependent DNA helicase RecG, partial [Pelagibacteraceae bacterium]|nr:ATP-dependent DNA helicase RecG [Pelagibacteraceae bacterium]